MASAQDSSSQKRTGDIVRDELFRRKLTIVAVVAFMLLGSAVTLIQPLFFKMLFDSAIPKQNTSLVWWLLLGMVVSPLVAIGISYFQGHLRVRIGESVALALRKAAFNHLIHVKVDAVEKIPKGGIVYRITRDAGKIGEMYIAHELLPVVSSAVMLLGTLVLMFMLNIELAVVFSIALPATYLVTRYLTQYSKTLDSHLNDCKKEAESFLYEILSGFRTMRMFNGESREKGRWSAHMNKLARLEMRAEALHEIMLNFPNEVINGLVIGILLGYGAFQAMDGEVTIGSLVAFMAYAPRAYTALRAVLKTYVGTRRIDVSVDSLDELFALPREAGLISECKPLSIGEVAPDIEFSNVYFKHDRGYGVEGLSFTIQRGEFVGIVGPSGGGKTTIIDLLIRLHDPERGKISVEGADIREVSLESLREHIAVVPQEVFLWDTTLAENIAYPESTYKMEDIVRAASLSEVHDFIQKQPDQYETISGERGLALSGGERQRIAMARALRKAPKILIFDEATSALDALTEEKIRNAIERVRIGRTTMVIAHRLSTILLADRVLVIRDGNLIESGSPRELVDRNGVFANLYRAQSLNFQK